MEVALWDMIAPIAKHVVPFGAKPHAGYNEGQLVWNCLLELSFDVARQCFDAGQADVERFRLYRECKENVIQEFGSLCVEAYYLHTASTKLLEIAREIHRRRLP